MKAKKAARLACLTLLISAERLSAANILFFRDFVHPTDALAQALYTSGHGVVEFPNASAFQAALSIGGYDLAVFSVQREDAAGFSSPIAALGQWVAAGGRAIYADWSGNVALAALFHASFTGAEPRGPVTITDPALAGGVASNPVPLRKTFWFHPERGLAPLPGGAALATYAAGGAAIVRGHGGRSLVYGFADDAPPTLEVYASGVALVLGTPPPPPLVGALRAIDVTPNSVTVEATLHPRTFALLAHFDFGLTTNYGQSTAPLTFPAGSNGVALRARFAGLTPNRTYHFRVRGRNQIGPVASEDASVTLPADDDGDQIGDSWETLHGLDPDDPDDAALDADGDGASNHDEFLAGTHPRQAASRFAISAVTRDAAGRAVITFTALPGHSYSVQVQDTLGSGDWETLSDVPAPAAAQSVSVTDPATGLATRFYQVVTPAQ